MLIAICIEQCQTALFMHRLPFAFQNKEQCGNKRTHIKQRTSQDKDITKTDNTYNDTHNNISNHKQSNEQQETEYKNMDEDNAIAEQYCEKQTQHIQIDSQKTVEIETQENTDILTNVDNEIQITQ